jgi:hypothetical protein
MASSGGEGIPLRVKLPSVALASILSMFFAEVFSGASPIWFLSGWGVFVTLPLYGGHLLLLINLAMRYGRTSISSLYLWGMLFGLYEAWITKVLWAGYTGATPGLGTFLGIGVQEFAVLVLFWHPVFSFIIPLLVYELLAVAAGGMDIHASHIPCLLRRRRNFILAGVAILIGSSFLNVGIQLNAASGVITIIGSVVLIALAFWLAGRNRTPDGKACIGMRSLRLGRKGLSILVVYMAALYAITFPLLLPERIPRFEVVVFTLAIYLAVIILLLGKRRNAEEDAILMEPLRFFSVMDLVGFAIAMVAVTTLLSLNPVIDFLLFYGFYWGITGLGCSLLLFSLFLIARDRRKAISP